MTAELVQERIDWQLVPEREKRAALYGRYSTDMQNELSVADQNRLGFDIARSLDLVVTHVEGDPATRAGAWLSRDGYGRIKEAARRGEFGVLIVENLNRFARQVLRGLVEVNDLTNHGVVFADVSRRIIDPKTQAGRMAIYIALESAEGETSGKRTSVRRGHRGLIARKLWPGGRPPLGLRRKPLWSEHERDIDGRPVRLGVTLEPDPETRDLALRIFEMYDNLVSQRQIGRDPEISSALVARQGTTTRRVRPHVSAQTIGSILDNQLYVGTFVWGKFGRTGSYDEKSGRRRNVPQPDDGIDVVDDYCEAIVPSDLFERVQKRRAQSKEDMKKRGNANRGKYLLSGLIECGACGFAYVHNSGGKNRPTYYCATRKQHGKDACVNKCSVFREPLEVKVRHIIETVVKEPTALAEFVAAHNRKINGANESVLAVVKKLEVRRAVIAKEKARYLRAIGEVDDDDDIPELVEELRQRKAALAEIDAQIVEARARVAPVLSLHRTIRDVDTGDASLFTGELVADRAFLNQLISKILVHADGSIVVRFEASAGLFQPVHDVRFEQPKVAAAEPVAKLRQQHKFQYEATAALLEMIGRRVVPGSSVSLTPDGPSYAVAYEGVLDCVSDPTGT